MAGLTEDMTRQRDDIESLRGARGLLIGKLGRDTDDLKADVTDFLADFRKRHMEMGRATRRDLMEFTSYIKDHVVGLKKDVESIKAGFLRGHMDMADILKDHLHAYISELKDDVADLLSGYREQRKEASKETKEKLLATVFNIKESVNDLADDVSEMISGFRQDHAEMARKGKAERKTFLTDLTRDVMALKKEIANLRKDFAEDISGAHKAWAGPSPEELKVLARRRAREEARRKKANARKRPSPSIAPDDLTAIQGIGPGMQGRLNKAGIFTFAQLAESEPKELRRILGKTGRMAAVEKWIGQAKQLIGK
jgi:predicted flap endonuclease-1-like 5' DNA nuclease/gas vesicle protein